SLESSIALAMGSGSSNSTGETALLISTRQNGYISYTISLYLIEHGADVNIVGANGISPLLE
ncbi:hypothetical protein, partial [Citrobacter youngae]|uniref:hypothetical protein n=1 Tax=Citrobacter youngae TaxID=133448 RepID=UPI001953431A